MKAAYMEAQGGPEVLVYGDLPDPVAGPDEVVIDIHAATVNGADWKVRAGSYSEMTEFPYILGRDFSGVVSEVGDGVDDLAIGDAVFGVCDVGQEGAYAEKIAMKASIIAKKPDSLSHNEAAALALTGLTALISVEDTLKLQPGETILTRAAPVASPASPSSWPSISGRRSSPLPALRIWAICSISVPTKLSITTPRISPKSSAIATRCSKPWVAMSPNGRSACCALAGAPPLSPLDPRPRGHRATTLSRYAPLSAATVRTWNVSWNYSRRVR